MNASRFDNDQREVIVDQVAAAVRELPREGILVALDRAIGRSKRRRQEAIYLLAEWADQPAVQQRIGDWLKDPDPSWRHILIQIIAHEGLVQFGPQLRAIIENDPNPACRSMAIVAAGRLGCAECLPALLRLAERDDPKLTWSLAGAFRSFQSEACRVHLQRWFQDASLEKSDRVGVSWALAKRGKPNAIAYLIAMLDDPDQRVGRSFHPGVSIRAAQASCDVFGWPFQWDKSSVGTTKALVAKGSPCP